MLRHSWPASSIYIERRFMISRILKQNTHFNVSERLMMRLLLFISIYFTDSSRAYIAMPLALSKCTLILMQIEKCLCHFHHAIRMSLPSLSGIIAANYA